MEALANSPSPSGFEQPAAQIYRAYTEGFADEVRTDVTGNVMAVLNPEAPVRIMLAGHIDEIGFVIHQIGDDGLLHFSGIGGHDEVTPVGQRVHVHGKKLVSGVVGSPAFHLQSGTEKSKRPEIKNLWIDIGAKSREEAEACVRLGDPITFTETFTPLIGDRAAARGFDNTAGAVIVAEALRLLKEDGGLHSALEFMGWRRCRRRSGRAARRPHLRCQSDDGHRRGYGPRDRSAALDETQHGSLHLGKVQPSSRG
jgi:endoglucanase